MGKEMGMKEKVAMWYFIGVIMFGMCLGCKSVGLRNEIPSVICQSMYDGDRCCLNRGHKGKHKAHCWQDHDCLWVWK
jgi:hypothetical protein